MRNCDWICYYSPKAIAYHARNWNPLFKNRKEVSTSRRYHSLRTGVYQVLKNETLQHFLPDILPILWFEILAFGYALFREPYLLKSYFFILKSIPRTIIWRNQIHKR